MGAILSVSTLSGVPGLASFVDMMARGDATPAAGIGGAPLTTPASDRQGDAAPGKDLPQDDADGGDPAFAWLFAAMPAAVPADPAIDTAGAGAGAGKAAAETVAIATGAPGTMAEPSISPVTVPEQPRADVAGAPEIAVRGPDDAAAPLPTLADAARRGAVTTPQPGPQSGLLRATTVAGDAAAATADAMPAASRPTPALAGTAVDDRVEPVDAAIGTVASAPAVAENSARARVDASPAILRAAAQRIATGAGKVTVPTSPAAILPPMRQAMAQAVAPSSPAAPAATVLPSPVTAPAYAPASSPDRPVATALPDATLSPSARAPAVTSTDALPPPETGTPARSISGKADAPTPVAAVVTPSSPAAASQLSVISTPTTTTVMPALFALNPAARDTREDSEGGLFATGAIGGGTLLQAGATTIPVAGTADARQQALDMGRHDWPQKMIDHIDALRDAANANDTSIRLVPDRRMPFASAAAFNCGCASAISARVAACSAVKWTVIAPSP